MRMGKRHAYEYGWYTYSNSLSAFCINVRAPLIIVSFFLVHFHRSRAGRMSYIEEFGYFKTGRNRINKTPRRFSFTSPRYPPCLTFRLYSRLSTTAQPGRGIVSQIVSLVFGRRRIKSSSGRPIACCCLTSRVLHLSMFNVVCLSSFT